MSDWPDIKSPDDWECNHWEKKPDSSEDKNTRLGILMGKYGEEIDVIKWMPNKKTPQWAIWKKTTDEIQ